LSENFACEATWALGDLGGSARGDEVTAFGTAARAKIEDVVGVAKDIGVMFHDDEGMARLA
jgi:hypothetical protein